MTTLKTIKTMSQLEAYRLVRKAHAPRERTFVDRKKEARRLACRGKGGAE